MSKSLTRIQHWQKTVKGDTVDHVKIAYKEGDKETTLHQFGEKAVPTPSFCKAFEAMNKPVRIGTGLPESVENGIRVRSISISYSEDKKTGDENTRYLVTCGLKAGHASVSLTVQMNHRYLPEGFEKAFRNLVKQANEYMSGKREQTRLPI